MASAIPSRPTSKSNFALSLLSRYFYAFEEGASRNFPFSKTAIWYWEIRQLGPPSDDITANPSDILLDISTDPVGVYQKTSTGWTSCWSQPPRSKKEFLKLPHTRVKDHFLWSTKPSYSAEKMMSYITQEELDFRGGTDKDKQDFLLEDLKTFQPITTAKTIIARRDSKVVLQTGKDARLNCLVSSSSSSTIDAGYDSDDLIVYSDEDLCDDDDGDGKDSDMTILSGEVVSGGDSVDMANEDSATTSCKIAEIAEVADLAQTILEQVTEISSMTSSLTKCPSSGNMYDSSTLSTSDEPPGNFPSSSSTSYPPQKFESDSIHSLLSRLTAAIEKERKEHLTKINNCE